MGEGVIETEQATYSTSNRKGTGCLLPFTHANFPNGEDEMISAGEVQSILSMEAFSALNNLVAKAKSVKNKTLTRDSSATNDQM